MASRASKIPSVHDSKVELLFVTVVGNAIVEGGEHFTLNHSGAGVYEFTLKNPVTRVLASGGDMLTASTRRHVSAVTGALVTVRTFGYNNTTPTDADFFLILTTSRSQWDK